MDILSHIYGLFDYITYTKIGGIIPLDIIAHFTVGAALTVALLKFKVRFLFVFTSLLILAVAKESLDFYRMGSLDLLEGIKDILISLSYAIALSIVRIGKGKKTTRTREYFREF